MFNNNRSETVAPIIGDDKIRDINKELSELGSIKAEYELKIEEGKKLSDQYNGLSEKVLLSRDEIRLLEFKISELKEAKSELEKFSKNVLNDNAYLITEIKENEEKLSLLENKISSINNEIDCSNKILSDINDNIKKLSLNQKEIENKYSKISSEVSKLNSLLIDKSLELESIEDKIKEKTDELNLSIKKLSADFSILSDKKTILEKNIEEKESELLEIKEEANTYKNNLIEEFEQYKLSEINKLDERDGEISNKAKFLKSREDFLLEVKTQLEEKLGKKIDIINF